MITRTYDDTKWRLVPVECPTVAFQILFDVFDKRPSAVWAELLSAAPQPEPHDDVDIREIEQRRTREARGALLWTEETRLTYLEQADKDCDTLLCKLAAARFREVAKRLLPPELYDRIVTETSTGS